MANTNSKGFLIDRKLLARIFSKIKVSTDKFYKGVPCWEWTAYIDKVTGYGTSSYKGKLILAHRLFYQLFVEMIPVGLHSDHLCRVRHCVNPAHIEPVTCQVNLLRGVGPTARNAQKTHCNRGHLLAGDNVSIFRNGRKCLTCQRQGDKRRWQEKTAKLGRIAGERNAVKTHCKNGHEFSGDNLINDMYGGKPSRRCRICHNERTRKSRANNPKTPKPRKCTKGELNFQAKLTEVQVFQIRALHPSVGYRKIAHRFNVSKTLIEKVVKREAWKHI